MPTPKMQYAIVFKTYTWDAFTERQAKRCREAAPGGDFYISLDTTNGDTSEIPFDHAVRISNGSLIGDGWPARVEHKSLLWWNADYPHYQFQRAYPQYDFYVFVEYDALFLGNWDELIGRLAASSVDFAAFPLRVPLTDWHWAQRHAATYASHEVQGCLMSISVQSRKALESLGERRLAMAREGVAYWPSAEVFLPTEVRRLGLRSLSLDGFGDGRRFDWHPPCLEEEALVLHQPAFVHPVYDRGRFLRWSLAHTATLAELLQPRHVVLQSLLRLPLHVALFPYLGHVWKAFLVSLEQRTRRLHALRESRSPRETA